LVAVPGDRLQLAVDPGCAPSLLYRLWACPGVAWIAPGRVQIRPDSLAGLGHRGIADLVRLLDEGLAEPLPPKTIQTLRGWALPEGRLAVRRVTLLESDDPALLATLGGQRGIRRHFRQAYGRRAVALESNKLESLLRKLRRQGLVPDVHLSLLPGDRPSSRRRWGTEDAGHLLLAARLYNRLPAHLRPTHYIADTTLARLTEGLPPRIVETVDQMVESTLAALQDTVDGWRAPPLAAEDRLTGAALDGLLDTLRRALAEGLALDMAYYTAGRGTLTRRTVEPLRLEDRGGVPYLVGYCRLRRAERVFRVDRIRSAQPSSQGGRA
jgi:hypothetical protein